MMTVFMLMLMVVMMLMPMIVMMYVNVFMNRFFHRAVRQRDVLRYFFGPADDDGNMVARDPAFLCAAEGHFDTGDQIPGSPDHFSWIV